MSDLPESTLEAPRRVERDAPQGFFSSWYIRITFGILIILVIVTVIAYVAYNEAKSSYSVPFAINHYSNMQLVSEQSFAAGEQQKRLQGLYEGLTVEKLNEIEAHYSRQMSSCDKLYVDGSGQQNYHSIVCEKTRTQNLLGFTQFTRLVIQPERSETGDLTGWVMLIVDSRWEE